MSSASFPASPRWRRLLSGALVLLLCGACTKDRRAQPPAGETPAVAAAPADTIAPFQGTLAATRRFRPASPTAQLPQLRSVRVTADSGYDRVVFEFADSVLPGYLIEYPEGPIRRCGSGDEVLLAGPGRLLVRLEPAQAHDERGNPTVTNREWAPRLPVVQEMKLVCDFEGQVEWAIGLAARRHFRVIETAPSAYLIVDVRHRD